MSLPSTWALAPGSGVCTTDEHHPDTCTSLNSASRVPWESGHWPLMFSHGELLGPLRGSLDRRLPDGYFVCYTIPLIACTTFPTFQVSKYLDENINKDQKVSVPCLRILTAVAAFSCASSCAWQVIIHPITLHQAASAGLCFSVHCERRGSFRRSIPHSTRQFAFPGQDASSWRHAISSCAAVNPVHPVKSVVTVNRQKDHRSLVWPSRQGISSRSSRVITFLASV